MSFSELDLIQNYKYQNADPLLVDVGAHRGSVTIAFAKKGWRVRAFEPEKYNFAKFIENTKAFDKVVCYQVAVSNVTGAKLPFYVSKEHFGIHSLKPFHQTHDFAYTVDSTTLDDVLLSESEDKVTVLKIDIEGADFLALQGFNISKFQPELVMVEFMDERSSPNFGYTHHEMVRFMKAKGYVGFVSEWMPIKEYGREGQTGEGHTWIKCEKYNAQSEPSWGNIIFVPADHEQAFSVYLAEYLAKLSAVGSRETDFLTKKIKRLVKAVPGAHWLYKRLRAF